MKEKVMWEQVAAIIIERSVQKKIEVTGNRLSRLVALVNFRWIVEKEVPLVDEQMEAWANGMTSRLTWSYYHHIFDSLTEKNYPLYIEFENWEIKENRIIGPDELPAEVKEWIIQTIDPWLEYSKNHDVYEFNNKIKEKDQLYKKYAEEIKKGKKVYYNVIKVLQLVDEYPEMRKLWEI